MLFFLFSMIAALSSSLLTTENKNTFLTLHNQYRSIVDPPAASMLEMKWDESLAFVAQNYSSKCIWKHNNLRSRQMLQRSGRRIIVGENIAAGAPYRSIENTMQSLMDESKNYNFARNTCSGVCGHYFQIVFEKASKVGCGHTRCASMAGFDACKANGCDFYVCNYEDSFNAFIKRPYKIGFSCQECPSTHPICKNGLCSLK